MIHVWTNSNGYVILPSATEHDISMMVYFYVGRDYFYFKRLGNICSNLMFEMFTRGGWYCS